MTLTVTHPFVSAVSDGADASVVRPSNWNANHTIAGSVALNEITAATGAVTIASGNNTGIVWNWANTADSTVCHTLGETSAATGGTSTSGVPNQVLLKLATVAASTQSPLSVYSRGAHVFSVSPTTAQILATPGTNSAPSFAFTDATNSGLISGSGDTTIVRLGAQHTIFGSGRVSGPANSATAPLWSCQTDGNSGVFILSGVTGITITNTENIRFSAGIAQVSKGTADAVSYAINSRKSRGTVASPTVITTGDDLLTLSGFGYVGATNTYLQAAQILFDSTGTIADATSGIGGQIKFSTTLAGTDTTPQLGLTLQGGSNPIMILSSIVFANLGTPANGTLAFCSDCDPGTLFNSTCASVGTKTGSFARRVNGAWLCD
jgi:hypothetical protein